MSDSFLKPFEDMLQSFDADAAVRQTRVVNKTRTTTLVPIEDDKPWSTIKNPTSIQCNTALMRFAPSDNPDAPVKLIMPDGSEGPSVSREGFKKLGGYLKYNEDFMSRLSNGMRADVLNELVRSSPDKSIQFTGDADTPISGVTTGWRDICSHAEVMQVAYDALKSSSFGQGSDPMIKTFNHDPVSGVATCKMLAKVQEAVTPSRGDIMRAGVMIQHAYGATVAVSLFTERLVCLNGMTRELNHYTWNMTSENNLNSQLQYIIEGVNSCGEHFRELIDRAKVMAATTVEGDPREALLYRMNAIGIHARHANDIIEAYEAEPGNTEWAMLNALTRFATHNTTISDLYASRIQSAAGEWAETFDIVNARIPRPMALKMGAEIIEA